MPARVLIRTFSRRLPHLGAPWYASAPPPAPAGKIAGGTRLTAMPRRMGHGLALLVVPRFVQPPPPVVGGMSRPTRLSVPRRLSAKGLGLTPPPPFVQLPPAPPTRPAQRPLIITRGRMARGLGIAPPPPFVQLPPPPPGAGRGAAILITPHQRRGLMLGLRTGPVWVRRVAPDPYRPRRPHGSEDRPLRPDAPE